jgi:hypothetical protein
VGSVEVYFARNLPCAPHSVAELISAAATVVSAAAVVSTCLESCQLLLRLIGVLLMLAVFWRVRVFGGCNCVAVANSPIATVDRCLSPARVL